MSGADPEADRSAPLRSVMAALEAQRTTLGDAVVDAALEPLRARLAELGGAAAPAPTAERSLRQVSVLFLDVVGSTRLGQQFDPEDVQAVLDVALARFSDCVRGHGGEVLQYAGDSMLAAFGAQGAREDNAECAVRCGLELLEIARAQRAAVQQRFGAGTPLEVRVGIHTGTVLRGGGVDGERTLRGHAVNVAARMEQAAPPGGLRVSANTWALVRGLFDAEALPPLVHKPHEPPLASWRVLREKPRHLRRTLRGVRGVETPMVGRDDEQAALDAVLAEARRDDAPRTVVLLADAGLGKSRLLAEFERHVGTLARRPALLRARSHPASELQPYGLLRDLLAQRFELAEDDDAEQVRRTLLEGLAPWLAPPADPAPELLGHLAGFDFAGSPAVQALGGDGSTLQRLGLAALGTWITRLAAAEAGLVLLLDDLQWADTASLDLLDALLPTLRGPVLVLASARPALLERRPALAAEGAGRSSLWLRALPPVAARTLTLRTLHGLPSPPAALVEAIQGRAQGNPYFTEELVNVLFDKGALVVPHRGAEVPPMGIDEGFSVTDESAWQFHPERLDLQPLPTTLIGVLQARIDTLAVHERRPLQLASVIGPVFWDDALARLDAEAPAWLPTLRTRSFVHLRSGSTFNDTAEEGFQHHLLHQVAYESLLKSDRERAHARTAEWLVGRTGDRGDELQAITAEHLARAGRWVEASQWYVRAAMRALDRGAAYSLAWEYLERAAALAGADEPDAAHFERLMAGDAVADGLRCRDKQGAAIDKALALAERCGRDDWRAQALARRSLLHDRLGHDAERDADARMAAPLAEATGQMSVAALAWGNLHWGSRGRGEWPAAKHQLAEGLRCARRAQEDGDRTGWLREVQLQLTSMEMYAMLDDEDARGRALSSALEILERYPAPRAGASATFYRALWLLDRAELDAAAAQLDELERVATHAALPHFLVLAQVNRGRIALYRDEPERAATLLAAVVAAEGDLARSPTAADAAHVLALAWRRSGRCDLAAAQWRALEAISTDDPVPGAVAAGAASALAYRIGALEATLEAADTMPPEAELDALAIAFAPAGVVAGSLGCLSRLAAWRLFARTGRPEAGAQQLAHARALLDHRLAVVGDADTRARVMTLPWFAELASIGAAATPPGVPSGP